MNSFGPTVRLRRACLASQKDIKRATGRNIYNNNSTRGRNKEKSINNLVAVVAAEAERSSN